MAITDKKAIKGLPEIKPSQVNMERRCENCACYAEGWCQLHRHTTNGINYGCKTHLTKEEFEAKMKAANAYLESENGIRVNYMLTLMFAMVSASYQIMIKGESMIGKLIGGKDWRFERKRALADIMKAIETIKTRYSTYFEKDYIQMMSDYGREDFDNYTYDGFQMFAGDLLMLGLTYFEHGYKDNEVLHGIIQHIRDTYDPQLNLFPPEFVEQFKIKPND